MTKLAAFWQTHRLGMFYGFSWAIVITFILISSYTLFLGKPKAEFMSRSFQNLLNPKLLIVIIAGIITGPIVTAIMRRPLKNRTLKGALWRGPLSLLIGSAFFGLISGQFDVLWRKMDGTDFGYTSIGALWYAVTIPFWAFTLFAPLFIPLACLNTWHLWKKANRAPAEPQAAG
jgi:hypothetical protein